MKEISPDLNEKELEVKQIIEPDFYMENGYMVLTEAFHLKRGFCCTNGCRHCPYQKEK